MAEKNLSLPFLTAFNPKGVLEAQRQLAALGSSVKNFAKGVIGAFGGVSATQASVNFIRNAITESRNLERETAALKTIFGETSDEMMAFAKNGVAMGLSTAQASKASTFLGSVLKQAGFEMDDVATNTKKLVALGADLATTYGYDVQEALTGMTALFRGEYDPIEKFGVAMKQAEVNTILAARGQKNLTGQQLLNAQQLIRLELLMQRTSDAQGAFARQGGSLFVQQAQLSALWDNMQATVGNQLTPALVKFLQTLKPIVENFAPHLEKIFASFGGLIEVIIPKLGTFSDKVAHLFDVISNTFNGANPLLGGFLGFIIDNIDALLTFIATWKILKGVIGAATTAMETYQIAVKIAAGATAGLTAAQMLSPWGLAAVGVAGLVAGLVSLDGAMQTAKVNSAEANEEFKKHMEFGAKNPFLVATSGAYGYGAALQSVIDRSKKLPGIGMSSTLTEFAYQQGLNGAKSEAESKKIEDLQKQQTASKVKTFFDDLNEQMKKQALSIKMSGLGASDALIEAVLGSTTWEKSANKIIAGGTKTVDFVQRQFNKTKAGLDEIAKAAEEAAKKLDEYNKAVQAATDFAGEMKDVLKELTSGGMTAALGEFEQQIVNTFDSIVSKTKGAVTDDLISQADANSLIAYADASSASMRAIAKQRDVLADRIATVRELITATKQAVTGFVNINNLLETQTKTVTESMVSISNGIRLTLTRSVDVTAVTGNITDKFREILAKTKQFALNLRELKRLGLDQNLFKQIVDGGLEAGGATAAAIIEGGAGTVSELNSLFADLQTTGTDIAEQTAQVMYGAGVDITNGLINGLLAQESALAAAAKSLADSFASTFNASMAGALKANLPAAPAGAGVPMSTIGIGGGLTAQLNAMGFFGSGVATGSSNTITAPQSVINLVVNAQNSGMTGTELAQQMITEIKKYERTNGAVWQAAN